MRAPDVPPAARPYVKALGVEAAIPFLLELGGATFYVADNPKGAAEITIYLGRERAKVLAAELRAITDASFVRVPTAKPFIAQHWRAAGKTVGNIARKLHVADSTVRRWLADAETGKQGVLPLDLF